MPFHTTNYQSFAFGVMTGMRPDQSFFPNGPRTTLLLRMHSKTRRSQMMMKRNMLLEAMHLHLVSTTMTMTMTIMQMMMTMILSMLAAHATVTMMMRMMTMTMPN